MKAVKRTEGLHVNPDGQTDVEKGAKLGAAGGAAVGAIAGAAVGPLGAVLGAVVGGAAGATGSGLAVAAVDQVDGDDSGETPSEILPLDIGNGVPGVQTGGHTVDGTPDTRGLAEKIADAVTGDPYDDKTGKRIDGRPVHTGKRAP